MRPEGSTFWLLNGRAGWRTATGPTSEPQRVSVSPESGIRLGAAPDGPLAMTTDSVGGLTLPRGMAFDKAGILYILSESGPWIKRFEPESRTFVTLPTVGGDSAEVRRSAGDERSVRRFNQPKNIAIAGSNLYVADWGNGRIQVFDLKSLALRHVWETVEGYSLFAGDSFDDLGKLAIKFRDRAEALSTYLWQQLAEMTKFLIQEHDEAEAPTEELKRALIYDLNRLLQGGSLYSKERFRHVRLPRRIQALLRQRPRGGALIQLNRRLLQIAYRDEIARVSWKPYDVTGQSGEAYILDRRHGRVFRHHPGADILQLVVDEPTAIYRWSRVIVDREKRIYLLVHPDDVASAENIREVGRPEPPYLDVYDSQGKPAGTVQDSGNIRDFFETPPVQLDHRRRFHLPSRLVLAGLYCESDFKDLGSLAEKLQQAQDPVSQYLKDRLSPTTLKLLKAYDGYETPDEALKTALLQELNRIIQSERLDQKEPFKAFPVPAVTPRPVKQVLEGKKLIHVNRLLLDMAYPGELSQGCWTWQYGPPALVDRPTVEASETLYARWVEGELIFDREGRAVRINEIEPAGPRLFTTWGAWFSEALDSQIYNCQWHRIELELASLPAGARVIARTYTDDWPRPDEEIRNLPDHLWDTGYAVVGQMQPPPAPDETGALPLPEARRPQAIKEEFLIQSQAGQYLWLKLELRGDGYTSPAVQAIQVHYPRQSYLEALPAVFSADEESRRFLEQFLAIFQTEWDDLESRIEEIARYFDPKAVPAGEFLEYLAEWLALPLEGEWDQAQKRNLLVAAPQLIPQRGTSKGLRQYLQIYLQNMTGLTPADQQAYPQIVEGFRERQQLFLSIQDSANLGRNVPLWGLAVVSRLQLGVFAREGEVRLVSTGDPERDVFHEFAHRFRVFVPSTWIKTQNDERMLRRALEEEKPAHTRYDLCLVEPRFRVGLQSTIGLDTILGDYPVARLNCPHDTEAPPSRPPRYRLGYDTILAGRPASEAGMSLTPSVRVGLDTILS